VALTGEPAHLERAVPQLHRDYEVYAFRPAPGQFAAIFTDVTARRQAQREREVALGVLRLANETRGSAELVRRATAFFQEQSGCEAVGLRLREGDDYPYAETRGFPPDFVQLENTLCLQGESEEVLRDAAGDPVLACMCGNVIQGRFDPTKPFFTEHGSFWTNCTTELLATTTEADRQARTRNRCNGEGYESVALIPLRVGEGRIGLLQLNDRQKGRFSPQAIALWERVAGYLAVALARAYAEEAVQEANAELERRVTARTAELQRTMDELESFSYSVSHDLRTPLRAVSGFSRILLSEHAEQLPPEVKHYLGRVNDGATQMGVLIDDLLALSRLGRQPLAKQRVDLGALTRRVLEDLQPELQDRCVDVCVAALPPCWADPSLVKQVLANLLSNAVKYSRGREQARIEVGFRRESGEVVYFVRDNGVGFSMEYAHKLFGVFQRLHRSDEFEGTGVGLAIVQRIVHRHGGRVWAEAAVGEGATFYFTLGEEPSHADGGD
jgi:signal transduction histidine kinase